MSGKLIVIEGVDGSGKTTQFKLLQRYYENQGKTVQSIHFPRHQQHFFGVLVDDYLNGKFGDATTLDPRIASILFACDRFEAKDQLLSWLAAGGVVILDRYMTSNKGHQLGKVQGETERLSMLKWFDDMEYGVFQIPKPDAVIYLDVDFDHIQKMLSIRGGEDKEYIEGERDQHEADENHIRSAQDAYRFTALQYDYWHTVSCSADGALLTPEEIHEKIISIVT